VQWRHTAGAGWRSERSRAHTPSLPLPPAQANQLGAVASAAPYEWGEPLPPSLAGAPWDLVLLSDLVYEPAALGPLVATLAALLEGGGGGTSATAPAAPAAEANGDAGRSSSGRNGGGGGVRGGGTGPAVLVAVELRVDTGVAQFVRQLVQRGLNVQRVRRGVEGGG
jgi:hypothetical protein